MMMFALLLHALCAIFLLGAISHQAASTWRSEGGRTQTLTASFARVRGALYARAVIVAYVLTVLLGDVVYGPYRVDVKTMLFDLQLMGWNSAFEIKEHLVAFGLYLLPLYWLLWRISPLDYAGLRRGVTSMLALIVWYALIVGHLLNNIKGVGFQ
jgi:hypothetical protein